MDAISAFEIIDTTAARYVAGACTGPLLFAHLTRSGVRGDTVLAFCVGASLMVAAGVVAAFCAVAAEGHSLEDIATPLSAEPDTAAPAPA